MPCPAGMTTWPANQLPGICLPTCMPSWHDLLASLAGMPGLRKPAGTELAPCHCRGPCPGVHIMVRVGAMAEEQQEGVQLPAANSVGPKVTWQLPPLSEPRGSKEQIRCAQGNRFAIGFCILQVQVGFSATRHLSNLAARFASAIRIRTQFFV